MNFLKIDGALKHHAESVSIIGTVLSISEIIEYQNKTGEKRKYFTVTIADDTSHTIIRIYNIQLKATLRIDSTFGFTNLLRKEQEFWAISRSAVIPWAKVEVPHAIRQSATTTQVTVNSPRKLNEALRCGTTSKVCGKVVQSSPVKYVRDGSLALKHVALKDDQLQPTVSISLFGQDAENSYNRWDVITISDVYRYKQTQTLSTKPSSTIQFECPESIGFDVTDDDKLDDLLFEEQDSTSFSDFDVLGIKYAQIYNSCKNFACKNKKMKDDKCPKCGSTETRKYCNVRAIVRVEDNHEEISIFQSELSRLVEIPKLDTFDQQSDFMDFITQKLPITGKGRVQDGKLVLPNLKRKVATDKTE